MNKCLCIDVGFVALSATNVKGQVTDFESTSGFTSDTVTNAGTTYLESVLLTRSAATTTTVLVNVTKISGTVGGTITLQGSLDGTNFVAINQIDTTSALGTFTAADASARYHWIISGSPFLYYRVSWTGTGTMAASFSVKLFRGRD